MCHMVVRVNQNVVGRERRLWMEEQVGDSIGTVLKNNLCNQSVDRETTNKVEKLNVRVV